MFIRRADGLSPSSGLAMVLCTPTHLPIYFAFLIFSGLHGIQVLENGMVWWQFTFCIHEAYTGIGILGCYGVFESSRTVILCIYSNTLWLLGSFVGSVGRTDLRNMPSMALRGVRHASEFTLAFN
jgi:hypothetical protein